MQQERSLLHPSRVRRHTPNPFPHSVALAFSKADSVSVHRVAIGIKFMDVLLDLKYFKAKARHDFFKWRSSG